MEWIKLSEELPKDLKLVLLGCKESGIITDGYYWKRANKICTKFGNDSVTEWDYWIPIPELPEEVVE